MSEFAWRSESDEPRPARLESVDDRLNADEALKRVRRGEVLLYGGDFRGAKQLLSAMKRRLKDPPAGPTLAQTFRAQRRARHEEAQTLSRVAVALDRQYRLKLAHAPDVAVACEQAWGPAEGDTTVVPLKALLGILGAAEWRKKGIEVPLLEGRLHPHYGVYAPTRAEYVELLAQVKDLSGTRVFDVGTGSGVLSLVLLQRGAASAVGTDVDARAVACANENAARLGLGKRFVAEQRALFPDGTADLVVCNPPWLPEPPKTQMDRAVFDEDSAFLRAFLGGLAEQLAPGGRGLLLLSDLAVHLGLRAADWLEGELARAGLQVASRHSTAARHGKASDEADPLHAARSREVTTLYVLKPR